MTYELTWTPQLGIFSLREPMWGQVRNETEDALRAEFAKNEALTAWLEYTKSNPNRTVAYNLLPS